MNRMRRLAAALILASSLPASARAASDAADSAYWDYRIPDHHWRQWTANLAGSWNHSDNSFFGARNRSGHLLGQLGTRASGGFDSDELFQAWDASLTFHGARRHLEQFYSDPLSEELFESSDRELQQQVAGFYALRAYPWAFPLGLTASTTQRLDFNQRFVSTDHERTSSGLRQVDFGSSSSGRWLWSADASIGTGLGRTRDVTPVYEAQVLEDRLLHSGALARPLSRPARERLIALHTVRGDLGFAHQRPDKYFWEEVQRVLVEDGALAGESMSLYDAHRILEPPTIRGRIFRSAGWFVGPSVRLSMQQTNFVEEYANTSEVYLADTLAFSSGSEYVFEDFRRNDFVRTVLTAEYHHPAGPNWQYDIRQQTSIDEFGKNMRSDTNASAMWVVSDRWLATASFVHLMLWDGEGWERAPRAWAIQYGADLSYFLEDQWAITLSAREYQDHFDTGFIRAGDYSLGITRVITGLFEAPGITAAMRPIPGGR
jgi:hypothetical protein